MPKYKIHQESIIGDTTVPADMEITIAANGKNKDGSPRHHVPGPHWEPLDDEARAICAATPGWVFTGEVPDAVEPLAIELENRMAKQNVGFDEGKLADAIAKGVVAGMAAAQTGAKPAQPAAAQPQVRR